MLHLIKELWAKCNHTTVVLGVVETLLVVGLSAALILRSPTPEIKTSDVEPRLRDSITVLMKQVAVIEKDKVRLSHQNDSLIDLKTNIQIEYQTKIKYIEKSTIDTVTAFIKRELRTN